MTGRDDLAAAFADINAWLFDHSLPLWASRGTDFANGGFIEKLAPDGSIMAEARRARVTGRQIYAFATAEKLGWSGPAQDLLRHGLVGLDRFISPAGLVVRTTDEKGRVLDDAFDLYDHAFVLFGLAAAASVGEKAADLEALAEGIRGRMQAGFAHPRAGFEESRPHSLPLKANPHMHMLEASLAWAAISDDPAWMALADEIAELCLSRFLDPETGALREYFDGDWTRIDTPPDDVVEPGHQFEWAWLLLRWGRLRQRDDALATARRLIAIGEGPGVDAARGLAINELNRDLSVRDDRCRLWPQTERTKAHCMAMALATDDRERDAAAARTAAALRGLMRFFAHPVAGAWYEHIGADGRAMIEPTRASSLYHITCAVAEVANHLG